MGNITSIDKIRLNNAEFSEIPKFSLNGLRKDCKILKIYDGDTLWLASALFNNKLYRFNVRMKGYDSPEMKPSLKKSDREMEIVAAKSAKKFLEDLILNRIVNVIFYDFDKYGRPLCEIYIPKKGKKCCLGAREKICVNTLMIEKGHGYPYNGGTKKEFTTRDEKL
tara:strand:+ start:109 stop:606 length:498 start_codon:yes stop_codon:yes gene_type:complete